MTCKHCGLPIYHAQTLLGPPLGPDWPEERRAIWRHTDTRRVLCAAGRPDCAWPAA